MSGRATSEIVADLKRLPTVDLPDGRAISGYEAADRLVELDAEVTASHDQIRNLQDACRDYDAERQGVIQQGVEMTRLLAELDALRPPCPTCGGTKAVVKITRDEDQGRGETLDHYRSVPCPDCVDGKVSIEQLAATWRAVWDDDHEAWKFAANWTRRKIRDVKPC